MTAPLSICDTCGKPLTKHCRSCTWERCWGCRKMRIPGHPWVEDEKKPELPKEPGK